MRPAPSPLAVKENAAEACTTACQDEQSAGLALAAGQGGDKEADNARVKEAFESCYTKCVAQETKDVAEERQKVSILTIVGRPSLQSTCCMARLQARLRSERLLSIAGRPCAAMHTCALAERCTIKARLLAAADPTGASRPVHIALTACHALLLLCNAKPGSRCSSRRLRRTLRRWWRGRRSSLATRLKPDPQ